MRLIIGKFVLKNGIALVSIPAVWRFEFLPRLIPNAIVLARNAICKKEIRKDRRMLMLVKNDIFTSL